MLPICPGKKVVVGGGPHLAELVRAYPTALFTGPKFGEDLAQHYASADVFVFPSRTDTFGLVLLEAMACGVPIAAYPLTGPIDIVVHGKTGMLGDDLAIAAIGALKLDRAAAREHACQFSWRCMAEQFLRNIHGAVSGRQAALHVRQPLLRLTRKLRSVGARSLRRVRLRRLRPAKGSAFFTGSRC